MEKESTHTPTNSLFFFTPEIGKEKLYNHVKMFNDAAKFRYSDVKSRVSSQNRNQFLDEKEGEKSFGIAVIDIIRNCLEEKQ